MAERTFTWAVLLVVLLVAALFRSYGLNWDGGAGAHPDERYIVGVAESLCWPDSPNPFAVAPDYAYGHLPLYLLALTRGLVRGLDPLLLGRVLAALFDLGTVTLIFALGRRVYDERVGLLAAAFVALMVLHVQQAHFYTADALLALFVTGALFFAVRLAQSGEALNAWLAGAWAGLALGTKVSAVLLVPSLGAACILAPRQRKGRVWRCGSAALATFALTNPFALLEFSLFWRNAARQAAIVRGALDVPYIRQYHATWPYLYPIVQQLRWGMGWALGLAAFGGLAYAVWRAVREPPRRSEWVLLAWTLPYFAFIGALHAKFPRYLLPLTPLLAIYAARLLCSPRGVRPPLWRGPLRGLAFGAAPTGLRLRDCVLAPLRLGTSALLLLCILLRCLAFVNLYRSPHPWLTASEWFYENVPLGSVIAVEQWDHPLPLDATGYDMRELPIFAEDTSKKWAAMDRLLSEADYLVVASRRGYGTLARWPRRYPRTARYYQHLFEGDSDFEPMACFGRHPHLGPVALVDDSTSGLDFSLPEMCRPRAPFVLRIGRLDESFVVYDHPRVIVFETTE